MKITETLTSPRSLKILFKTFHDTINKIRCAEVIICDKMRTILSYKNIKEPVI